MANKKLYGPNKPLKRHYNSTARSATDTTTYFPSEPPLFTSSSLYPSTVDRHPFPSSDDVAAGSNGATTSLWPSFDVSSALSKRPLQALYNRYVLGAHMIGQKAWLTSDSLHKRPKLESASILPICPQRPGEKDCTHYMLTRTCKFGDTCKFDHPIWVPAGGIPDWKETPTVPCETHPERPGAPDCPYFLKTQKCKFGLNCKFNHPNDKLDNSGKTDASGLPERPSEPMCSFYMKTGHCKFGASCKFHHPKDAQVPSDENAGGDGVQTDSVADLGSVGDNNSVKTLISTPASSHNSKGLPIRLGEVDCPFYMKTGSCKYGASCRYNHPDMNELLSPFSAAAMVGHAVYPSLANFSVGLVNPAASFLQSLQPGMAQSMFGEAPVMYPQRPGQTECDYYMKSGVCKYGERCRYHHPIDRSGLTRKQALEQNVELTLAGLPRREGVQHCPFYMKTSTCRYGINCKFDHPPPGEVLDSAGNEASTEAEE